MRTAVVKVRDTIIAQRYQELLAEALPPRPTARERDAVEALRLAEAFRQCRCRMARRLARSATPVDCLKVAGTAGGGTFLTPTS